MAQNCYDVQYIMYVYEPWYPLAGRSHRKRHQTRFCLKYPYSLYVNYAPLPPFNLQRCLPIVVSWTPTTGLHHARFIQDMLMGHVTLQYALNTGKHHWCDGWFHLSLSPGVLNLIPNMWQLVFANVPVKGLITHSNEHSFFYYSNEGL